MEIKLKFQVGDIVYLKHRKTDKTRLFIMEIHTVTCSAGTQIFYRGKVYYDETRGFKEGVIAHILKQSEYHELELDCVIEEQREAYDKRKV